MDRLNAIAERLLPGFIRFALTFIPAAILLFILLIAFIGEMGPGEVRFHYE